MVEATQFLINLLTDKSKKLHRMLDLGDKLIEQSDDVGNPVLLNERFMRERNRVYEQIVQMEHIEEVDVALQSLVEKVVRQNQQLAELISDQMKEVQTQIGRVAQASETNRRYRGVGYTDIEGYAYDQHK